MAFVNLTNLTVDFNMPAVPMTYAGSGGVENGGVASYVSDLGPPLTDVELFGTASISGGVVSGTVTQLQMDFENNNPTTPDVAFTNVSFDGSVISSGTDEEVLEAMVGGSNDFFDFTATNSNTLDLYGDYEFVANGQFLEGGDDWFGDIGFIFLIPILFAGSAGGNNSDVWGDAVTVSTGGNLIGGNDRFNGAFDEAYGDAGTNNGTVFGGNDTFTIANIAATANGDIYYGDVDTNNETVIGGNDIITAAEGVTENLILIGDVDSNNQSDSLVAGGDDIITGGDGNDFIYGDIRNLANGFATGGNDELNGGAGNDTIYGDAAGSGGELTAGGRDIIRGQVGNDTIFAGAGNDFVDGGLDNDTINGDDGDDTLYGSFGTDTVNGGAGNDILRGNNDNDTMDGGSGNDQMFGGVGVDIMNGGTGNDTIDGSGGFDTLNGGAGNDTLTGGFNADTFVFDGTFGDDTITDFSFTNNFEKIDLSGVASILSFVDLINNHISDSGAGAVIDDGSGNTITLTGVTVADLDAGDFIF